MTWDPLILFIILVAAGLLWKFRPRCERHNQPLAFSSLPSLGCTRCIEEDTRRYWEERRAAEKAKRREIAQELLSDSALMKDFIAKLKEFRENDLAKAENDLDAAIREGRHPGPPQVL